MQKDKEEKEFIMLNFKRHSSIVGFLKIMFLFLGIEGLLIYTANIGNIEMTPIILLSGFVYTLTFIVYQLEVISRERDLTKKITTLYIVTSSFVIYFAFQYWFLSIVKPNSFIGSSGKFNPIDYIFHSMMVFVFSPMIKPLNNFGQILMIEQIIGTITIVMFVLQNMWNIKTK